MSFFRDYVNYFRWQCAHHPDLLHAAVLGSRIFAVIDQEAARGDFRSGAKEKGFIFRLIEPSGGQAGDADPVARILGGFIIARYHSPRKIGDEDQSAAMDDAWRVGTDIMAKIANDSRNGHPLWYHSANHLAQLDTTFQPRLAVGDTNYVGWLFTFRWQVPVTLCLGAAGQPAWTDGGETPANYDNMGIGWWGIEADFLVQ
jgi:hypothetical protein